MILSFFPRASWKVRVLNFIAKDSSNNVKSFDFTLNVVEKINSVTEKKEEPINYIDYSSIYNEHKNDNTLVGIDVSKWQGDIDFDLLKENKLILSFLRYKEKPYCIYN